jgi:hypothetical protein
MNDKLQVDENTLRTMQELLRVGSGILERDKLAPAGQRDRIVEGAGPAVNQTSARLSIAAFARRFEQIQRRVDLGDKALDLVALVGARIFLQPFEQLLLSSKEVGQRCHWGAVSQRGAAIFARRVSSSQSKFGLTSAPRRPQALQMKRGSRSESRTSSGHRSPLIVVVRLQR